MKKKDKIFYYATWIVDFIHESERKTFSSNELFIERENLIEEIKLAIQGKENCVWQYINRLEEEKRCSSSELIVEKATHLIDELKKLINI